jgi:hypothetical protein
MERLTGMRLPILTWFRELAGARLVAAALITAVTAAVVGGVLVSTTTVACGPAQKAGLKLHQCARPVAAHVSPSPYPIQYPSPYQAPYAPTATAPYSPPASQPYYPPSTGPYPPQGPAASAGSYPPFTGPASGPPTLPLNCRLPIFAGGPGSGGFIVFPGGNFIADPASAVTVPATGSTSPQQGAYFGLTYDAPLGIWLPVQHSWMSPDGGHYAFPSSSSVYVVDAKSKALTEVGKGHTWSIVGVTNTAVYAEIAGAAGLWKLPFAGDATELTSAGFWRAASTTAAYGSVTSSVPNGATNTIIRFDFASGQTDSNFFTRDGSNSTVVGLDAQGNPIIQVGYYAANVGNEVWIATSSGATAIIGYTQDEANLDGIPIGDSNGLWMPISAGCCQVVSGIALYVPGQGVYWMSSLGGQLAGGCS